MATVAPASCRRGVRVGVGIVGRSVGYGAVVGAGIGTAVGLPFMIIGAFYGCPIGAVYGTALGILNAPVLVVATFRWSTRRASRIAAAITSGSAGLATVIIINHQLQPLAAVIVTIIWAGIGALVAPRAAFGKQRKASDSNQHE